MSDKDTHGNVDKDGNLKSREEEVEEEYELVDEEDMKVPAKSRRTLMPIELL